VSVSKLIGKKEINKNSKQKTVQNKSANLQKCLLKSDVTGYFFLRTSVETGTVTSFLRNVITCFLKMTAFFRV